MLSQSTLDHFSLHGEMALQWLTWRPNGKLPSRLAPSDLFESNDFPAEQFCTYICQSNRELSTDDVRYKIEVFRDAVRSGVEDGASALVLLWIAVLRSKSISITFDNSRPELKCDPRDFEQWLYVTSELDPDALACLELALSNNLERRNLNYFDRWPLIFDSSDRDLKSLLAKGLSDMHIHMTSLAYTAISWQRILRDHRLLKRLDRFQDAKNSVSCSINHPLRQERKFIVEGLKCAPLGSFRHNAILYDFFEKVEKDTPGNQNAISGWVARDPRKLLAPYRASLYKNWRAIGLSRKLEARFAQYLSAKTLFRRHHLQHISDTNPGLHAFDIVRKGVSKLGRFHLDETTAGSFSKRRFFVNNALLVAALKDDHRVIRADMRVAPPAGWPSHLAANYANMAIGLSKLFDPGVDGPDLGSSLHFKRALARPEPRKKADRRLPSSWPILRKIVEFDLDTASFHLMRSRLATSRRSDLRSASRLYRRLDLASPERGAGPWTIAPFIRLLRGDAHTLEALSALPKDAPFAARWVRMLRHKQANPIVSAPPLGLTCHAGEDFDTLVQGLSHIAGAVEAWRMGPGDGLGHCLALGPSAPEREKERCRRAEKYISAGNDLDGLVWLLKFVDRRNLWSVEKTQRLTEVIRSLASDIYFGISQALRFDPSSPEILKEKLKSADNLLPVGQDYDFNRLKNMRYCSELSELSTNPGEQLWLADHFCHDIAERRQQIRVPHAIHDEIAIDLACVQDALIDEIKSKGVVIETNPSSNLRMVRGTSHAELPLVPLMTSANTPRIVIGTDNPGVYDTNVAPAIRINLRRIAVRTLLPGQGFGVVSS